MTEQFKEKLHQLIQEFPDMTVAETIGTLELVKYELFQVCPNIDNTDQDILRG